MLLGDVVDQLHHVHGLADAGAAEQANFTSLGEGTNKVDHLDAGFKQIDRRRKFVELRCQLVNFAAFIGGDRPGLVDWPPKHVNDAPDSGIADRNRDAGTGVIDLHSAAQTIGGAHGDGAYDAVAQLLLYLEDQFGFTTVVFLALVEQKCVIDIRHRITRELNVHYGSDTLNNVSLTHRHILNQ